MISLDIRFGPIISGPATPENRCFPVCECLRWAVSRLHGFQKISPLNYLSARRLFPNPESLLEVTEAKSSSFKRNKLVIYHGKSTFSWIFWCCCGVVCFNFKFFNIKLRIFFKCNKHSNNWSLKSRFLTPVPKIDM